MKGTKYDNGKPRWTLLPLWVIEGAVRVMTFGASKYQENNWQLVDKERYWSALFRHLTKFQNGEDKDEETGESHLYHALCCLIFYIYLTYKDCPTSSPKS